MDKKTIVVVGAGQGLGNHVAKRFGKEGFRVVLMARNGESLKRYQQEFTDEGIETFVHEADAEQPQTLETAFDWVKQQFGAPDVLVYNVGITATDIELTDEEYATLTTALNKIEIHGRRCALQGHQHPLRAGLPARLFQPDG